MKKVLKKSVPLFLALAVLILGLSIPAAASALETTEEAAAETVQETVPEESSEQETVTAGESELAEETTKAEETTAAESIAETEETTATEDPSDVAAVRETASGTTETAAPAKVTGLKAESGEHAVTLTWKAASGAYAYKICIYNASDKTYTYVAVTKKTTYTVTDLEADTEYTFVVRSYALSGDQKVFGNYSKKVSATPYSVIPAKVTGVKAKVGDTRITLTWNEAEDATGYLIYSYDSETGKYIQIKKTTKLKYTVTGLENDTEYTYVIRAYRKYGTEGNYDTGKKSKKVSATPKFAELKAPSSLEVTVTDSGNVVEWSKVTNATGYIIYRYNIKTGKYTRLTKVQDSTTYKDKKAKTATYYKYKVIAYRNYQGKVYKSDKIVKAVYDPDKIATVLSKVHAMYYSATVKRKAPVYTSISGKKIAKTVSAGTKVTITYRRSKSLTTVKINGKKYYMNIKYLRLTSQKYTSKDYTTEEKEVFVNGKGFTSTSKYLIWVSTYTQRINVFKKSEDGRWVLYKTARCGTGLIDTPTPLGTYKIYAHMRAHYYNTCSYSYWSKFKSTNAIHQRGKYYSNGAYVNATLGRPVSHGCVRTTDSMAQFIYYKVPLKTTIVIY
ncbi:MAG: fibronectin type III domain-containing protein [Lachnospiraceae bacterium]|nr:fibronectin type III domain-containing protein [Lachnospiraceae bacterium]